MIILENEVLKLQVKLLGAELVSIYNKDLKRELLWHGDATYWKQSSPHLFPIVGKVFENTYKVDGKTYHLPQHGFLREQTFALIEQTDNTLVFRFDSGDRLLDVYPYRHAVEITYTLIGSVVEVSWNVINLDEKDMYYSIGAHPGFNIDKSHSYRIEYELDGPNQHVILGDGYIKELVDVEVKDLHITEDTFINDAVMYTGVSAVSLVDETTDYRIRMEFKGFEYIAIWSTLKTGSMAPFICLEPWLGLLDDFGGNEDISLKRGIQMVEVGKSKRDTYRMEF